MNERHNKRNLWWIAAMCGSLWLALSTDNTGLALLCVLITLVGLLDLLAFQTWLAWRRQKQQP